MRFFGLALAAFTLAGAAHAQERNLTVKGSDTMVILGQRWAEEFMSKDKVVTIQVTGGGSGVGIAALINGSTDIAEASRPMKEAERKDLQAKRNAEAFELPVAVDGLAIYVHEKNPVNELTLKQLKGIFTGAIKNWKAVGGKDERIIPYSRENSSGTYAYFKEHVLENGDYASIVQSLPGTAAVINAVARDQKSIAFGGIAYAKGIKVVRVKKDDASPAIEPSMDNVLAAKYPISRFLYWYFAGRPGGDAQKFARWVLSKEGQGVVEKVGYYPLAEADRIQSENKIQ